MSSKRDNRGRELQIGPVPNTAAEKGGDEQHNGKMRAIPSRFFLNSRTVPLPDLRNRLNVRRSPCFSVL